MAAPKKNYNTVLLTPGLRKRQKKAVLGLSAGAGAYSGFMTSLGRPGSATKGAVIGAAVGVGSNTIMGHRNKLVRQGKMSKKEADQKNRKTIKRSMWGGIAGGFAHQYVKPINVRKRLNHNSDLFEESDINFGVRTKRMPGGFSHSTTKLNKQGIHFAETNTHEYTFGRSKKMIDRTAFPMNSKHTMGSVRPYPSRMEHMQAAIHGETATKDWQSIHHSMTGTHTHVGVNPYKVGAVGVGAAAAVGGGVYAYRHRQDIKDFYYRHTKNGRQVRVHKGKRKGRR